MMMLPDSLHTVGGGLFRLFQMMHDIIICANANTIFAMPRSRLLLIQCQLDQK